MVADLALELVKKKAATFTPRTAPELLCIRVPLDDELPRREAMLIEDALYGHGTLECKHEGEVSRVESIVACLPRKEALDMGPRNMALFTRAYYRWLKEVVRTWR